MKRLILGLLVLSMTSCVVRLEKVDNVQEIRFIANSESDLILDCGVSLDEGVHIKSDIPGHVCEVGINWIGSIIKILFILFP